MHAQTFSLPLLMLGLLGLSPCGRAQLPPPPVSEAPAALTPVHLFESLARETKPLWRQQYRAKIERTVTNREKAALALGAVMTDLSLAMMARDGQQIHNLVQDEEALEKLLGITDKMRSLRQRYLSSADGNEWPGLGKLIEKAQERQEELLITQRDAPLSSLVTIGRWLRCWQICASVVTARKLSSHELAIGSPQVLEEISVLSAKVSENSTDRHLRYLTRKLQNLSKMWQPQDPDQVSPDRLRMTLEILDELIGQLVQDEPRPPAPVGVPPR